jgi:beta-xylosidase
VCTNVVHEALDGSDNHLQNFIISTRDIHANTWSDPVPFSFHGIDPSLFFAADGTAYICGSRSPGPATKIVLFEIDVATGANLTEERELWHGTGGIYPEGPHIYFHAECYYLLIAEGGTHEGHSVTMARSKRIWGPYEASPNNPILSASGTRSYVQATGHCEAFADTAGQWWGVCLGVRQRSEGMWFDSVAIQLEGFADVDEENRLGAAMGVDWMWIRDPEMERYEIGEREVRLRASRHDFTAARASPTFVGKRQRRLEGRSGVTLIRSEEAHGVAGLAVYKDEHRFLLLSYSSSASSVSLRVLNKAQGIDRTLQHDVASAFEKMNFVLEYTETEYKASYSLDEGVLKELGVVRTRELSDKDFVGPIVGVVAVNEGASSHEVDVRFENFVVDGA